MSLDESYPGIQPTTARKAGDLLTFTSLPLCGRCRLRVGPIPFYWQVDRGDSDRLAFGVAARGDRLPPLGQLRPARNNRRVLSKWCGIKIVFTWLGAALASAVVSFPLMVRAIRLAFQGVDPRYELAARSLGASRLNAFFTVALPLARRGLIAGFMLAFARSLGEFGATIMVAGNIEGKTRTIPLAIYTMANTPDGMEETWRLVGLSILLACAALAGQRVA